MRADDQRTAALAAPRVLPRARDGDDDAAVIRQSMTDPERFAILVRRHAPAIQRYVTRRIGAGGAEGVVAETFLAAFRQRAGYADDGRDCLPWLYGIATRLAHRHWRSEAGQLRLLARTGGDPVMGWEALLGTAIMQHPGQLP